MFKKIKNMDPQTKLVVKAVAGIIVINALAIAINYASNKNMIAELDAAE